MDELETFNGIILDQVIINAQVLKKCLTWDTLSFGSDVIHDVILTWQ